MAQQERRLDLHELMKEISAIPGARFGRGPLHPTEPDRKLVDDLIIYLDCYKFLRTKREYVRFLEAYAGMHIFSPQGSHPITYLEVFGLGLFAEEEELVGPEGFCAFSQWYDDELEFGITVYFFPTSPDEEWVYRKHFEKSDKVGGPMERAYSGFFEWLAAVVARKGYMRMEGKV